MKLIETVVKSEEGDLPFEWAENRLLAKAAGRITVCRAVYSFAFQREDKLFINGYQSWTYSPERSVGETDLSMRFCPDFFNKRYGFSSYGDGYFYQKSYRRGWLHGYSYAYIRRGEEYYFIGSVNEDKAYLRIIFDSVNQTITLESDCAGRRVEDGFVLMDYLLLRGSEESVFDRWFDKMQIPPVRVGKRTGYTSWYRHYQNISEDILLNDLAGMSNLPIKSDIFQIDDGYESKVGDWLFVDKEKFPSGLEPIVKAVKDAKYHPGLWLAPFVCERESALFSDHPDWLLKDGEGNPVFAGGNWSGAYALDFKKQEVKDYIEESISFYKKMGFSFFKLDFLYAVCMVPDENRTRAEIMADAMKFLRRVCGKAEILGCGVPLASAFGRVDYCRIGMDASLSYDGDLMLRPFHNERPSTKNTMRNSVYRRPLSGRGFLNDPDVFLLRKKNAKLTEQEKRSLAIVNALFGGVLFSSDDFGKYGEAEKDFYAYLVSLQNATLLSVKEEKKLLTVEFSLGGEKRRERLYFA